MSYVTRSLLPTVSYLTAIHSTSQTISRLTFPLYRSLTSSHNNKNDTANDIKLSDHILTTPTSIPRVHPSSAAAQQYDNKKLQKLSIESYSNNCFELSNNVTIIGSICLTQGSAFVWSINKFADITTQSIQLIELMQPIPELIIFGCGNCVQQLPRHITDYLNKLHISYDVFDSGSAAATYNILNDEQRNIIAFLIATDDTQISTRQRTGKWI